MFAVTMHGTEYAGSGSNGAVYALEAFNAALHSHRAYVCSAGSSPRRSC